MVVSDLCPQAFIFLCFSLTQVTIDTVKGEYNKALFKFWIMIIFTLLLNNLCMRGLGIISWTIIFMPFMLMSIITAILLYVFGLDPTTGKLKYYTPNGEETIGIDSNRNPMADNRNDENSKFARPIDLVEYRIKSTQNQIDREIENDRFAPDASETSNAIMSQSAKTIKTITDKKQEKTVVYKKDKGITSESYCDNN